MRNINLEPILISFVFIFFTLELIYFFFKTKDRRKDILKSSIKETEYYNNMSISFTGITLSLLVFIEYEKDKIIFLDGSYLFITSLFFWLLSHRLSWKSIDKLFYWYLQQLTYNYALISFCLSLFVFFVEYDNNILFNFISFIFIICIIFSHFDEQLNNVRFLKGYKKEKRES